MLIKWTFSGFPYEKFIRSQIGGGDSLMHALGSLPLEKSAAYTFMPENRIIKIASERDFQRSLGPGTGEAAAKLEQFVYEFLARGGRRAVFSRFGEFDSLEDEKIYARLRVPYFFVDPPAWMASSPNKQTAYLYLSATERSMASVSELFREAAQYPTVIVLGSIPSQLVNLRSGIFLTKNDAEAIAEEASYILVGAFDEQSQIICELPPPGAD